jgi:hypothetical protein
MKIKELLGMALLILWGMGAAALAMAACTPRQQPRIVDVSPGPLAVQTALCLDESAPVPAVCEEVMPLPECLAEDDVIDGTPGPACWWHNQGQLWYNDGTGER